MRGLDIHENIGVSDIKLMLGLRVCFISSDMTANKLFPINPRAVTGPPNMSLLLEVNSTSALIIEPGLILVAYMDDLGGYITSNQKGKMLIQNPHRIIIIIIKKGWQYKAGRERLTPYQSEDPNPTTPTHRKKEEKGKTVGDKKGASS